MDENKLIIACKRGEVSALKIVYERYYSLMYGVCLRYLKNVTDAEDLVQEGFMKIFKDIGSFKGKGSFEGWMKKVMINNVLAYLRKHKNEFVSHDIDSIAEDEMDAFEEEELTIENQIRNTDFTREELIGIIQSLPQGYQQVLNLFVVDEFKHQEIATVLNISEGTSKSQLNRARKLVKKRLFDKVLEKEAIRAKNDVI